MKTPHALGLILLAVVATVAIEESRIAKLRSETQPTSMVVAGTASASATPSIGDPAPATPRPSKTERTP